MVHMYVLCMYYLLIGAVIVIGTGWDATWDDKNLLDYQSISTPRPPSTWIQYLHPHHLNRLLGIDRAHVTVDACLPLGLRSWAAPWRLFCIRLLHRRLAEVLHDECDATRARQRLPTADQTHSHLASILQPTTTR